MKTTRCELEKVSKENSGISQAKDKLYEEYKNLSQTLEKLKFEEVENNQTLVLDISSYSTKYV